jgi:hypothetical protein
MTWEAEMSVSVFSVQNRAVQPSSHKPRVILKFTLHQIKLGIPPFKRGIATRG